MICAPPVASKPGGTRGIAAVFGGGASEMTAGVAGVSIVDVVEGGAALDFV